MDPNDKPQKPSSPPPERYYPSSYGPDQPGGYPPIPPLSAGPPASDPGRPLNGVNGAGPRPPNGDGTYRPYNSMPSLPLHPQPSSLPSQPSQSAPPSMVEIPPQQTMSTVGSVVGGGTTGGTPGGTPIGPLGGPPGGAPGAYGGYPPGPPAGAPPGLTQSPGPAYANSMAMTNSDLRSARANVEAGLGRLISLQRQHRQHLQYGPGAASVPNSTAAAVQEQLRLETGYVLRDLRYVRRAVSGLAKAAENHRFRRWLVGGLFAAFIPLVRRLFRRRSGATTTSASNDTEYAFVRSRSLVDRMLTSVRRRGGLASIAFFVFAVLYIFSNEVSLRVARTVGRRLKRLSSKIERGDELLDEADLKQLAGWRWRVLLWGRQ